MVCRCFRRLGIVSVLWLSALGMARGAVVYSNGFETAAGAEWSSTARSVTPAGARHFLGPFGNQTVKLTLNNLPAHTGLRISFDLYVILYWTGNGTYYGPHLWEFGLAGAPPLLHTTFSNGDQPQAYPGNYPEVNNPPYTGATEVNTLGYTPNPPGDSVYHITRDIYHTTGSVTFQFTGIHLQGLPNTTWGLDNVVVETAALPMPAPSRASIVVNGDFETPIVGDNSNLTLNAPSTGITGWTLSKGSVDLTGTYWQNASGRQSVDMDGYDYAGTLYQDLPTAPGKSYLLSFSLAGNPGGPAVKTLEVWWNGTLVDTPTFDTTGKSAQDMGWVRKQYLVTTPITAGNTTRLQFDSLTPGSFGSAIDAVSVVPAVPGDLVMNGEFEDPNVGTGHVTHPVFDTFGGWSTVDGPVAQVGTEWQANEAKQSIALNGGDAGSLTQNVSTTPGETYLLRFAMAGDPGGGPALKSMEVDWSNTPLETQTFDTTGKTRAAMGWSQRAYVVQAPTNVTALTFRSLTAGAYGPALDSVSVARAVPGDADQDGAVTISDAVLALRQVTGADAPDAAVAALSDVMPWAGTGGRLHGNGTLAMDDVRTVLRIASWLSVP